MAARWSVFNAARTAVPRLWVAVAIGSGALAADARQTVFCAYLCAILLGGLLLYALVGWWWADPAAALSMVPIIAREGLEAVRGRSTCGEECR